MSKRTFIALMGAALVVVLATGGLIASNMGFKLNYELSAAAGEGLNTLALPYNQEAGLVNWGDVRLQIGPSAVIDISTWAESSGGYKTYAGAKADPILPIVASEGVFAKMSSTVNYIIAGSHNTSTTTDMNAGGIALGLNLYGPPYHSTAGNVGDIGLELGGFSGAPVIDISGWAESSGGFNTYAGAKADPIVSVVPGEAYFVKMGSTVLSYSPAHY